MTKVVLTSRVAALVYGCFVLGISILVLPGPGIRPYGTTYLVLVFVGGILFFFGSAMICNFFFFLLLHRFEKARRSLAEGNS